MMSMSRSIQFALRALAVAFAIGSLAAWIFVPRLVESAYSGTSWPFFNDLITGQDQHALSEYLDLVRRMLVLLSVIALAMSALAIALSIERGRQAIRGIGSLMALIILPVVAFSWVTIRAMASLDLGHFGDEDEKIVAAWLISDGERLYESIFAHHGPLNYMLAHAVYALTESKDLAPYRIVQWFILGLGGIAVAASPILTHWRQRIYAASTFLILAAILYPVWRGQLLLYHVHGGVLFTTAVSLLFLPLALGVRVPIFAAGIAGCAMAAMVAAAYPFVAPLALMFTSTSFLLLAQGELWRSTKELIIPILIGALLVLVLVGGWIVLHGDLVGYLVYHLYFNQEVYAPFINFDSLSVFKQLSRVAQPGFGWALWILLIFSFWLFISISARQKGNMHWRTHILAATGTVAMLAAFLYLNPRDTEELFKTAALQVTSMALFSIIAARGVTLKSSTRVFPVWNIALPLLLFFLIGVTQFTQLFGTLSRDAIAYKTEESAVSSKYDETIVDAIHSWVEPSGRIQALVFNPRWYLLTRRRPASGHYYYLPWQAAYSSNPILGKNIDVCADLEKIQPEVIIWDRWKVWGKYDLKDYEPCLYELITTQYESVEEMPAILRRSRR